MNRINYKEADEKLKALWEIKVYKRALSLCKWWQYHRKKKYKTLIDVTKYLNNV